MVSNIMSFKVVEIFKRTKTDHSVGGVHMCKSVPVLWARQERLGTWEEEQVCFQRRDSGCVISVGGKLMRTERCGDFLTSHQEFPRACKAHRMGVSWDLVSLGRDS